MIVPEDFKEKDIMAKALALEARALERTESTSSS